MPNFAHINLIGHLGKDPEGFSTQGGNSGIRFSLAVGTGFGDHKVTSWYEVTMWGKRAEAVKPLLCKGKAVLISGEPSVHKWSSEKGNGTTVRVTANDLVLIGNKPEQAQDSQQQSQAPVTDDGADVPF
jgi:single-strand DNA-binding protein